MAHNNPCYDEGDEPLFCSVCGSPMIDTTISEGFDEKTGIEKMVPARICKKGGDSHGVRVQRQKTKVPPPTPFSKE